MNFDDSLAMGQAGESAIAQWLRRRGCTVLPVYEKIIDTGKGPHLFLPEKSLVAPDLFVFKGQNAYWMEAKHKTVFSWYGKARRFVTGIDLRHYDQYLQVADSTPWPVWLLFLHKSPVTDSRDVARWDAPSVCPVGLFGNTLDVLAENESHRSDKHGRSGMVYWAQTSLKFMASLDDVLPRTQYAMAAD